MRTKSSLYSEDLQAVYKTIDLSKLNGKRIFITGATGMIGSALVDLLSLNDGVRLYLGCRSVQKAQQRFSYPNVTVIPYDATKPFETDISVDFIVHAASNAAPTMMTAQPVETMISNFTGTLGLLQYARSCHAERFLFVSSSEVYGKSASENAMIEGDVGRVELLDARSAYPMGKRAAETLCECYRAEYGVDYVIARPGHIYGPTAQRSDSRISSDFAFRAASGEKLFMKSAGTQLRSYVYCLDCASAILTILLKGKSGEAYNIADNACTVTIRDMAEILAKSGGVPLEIVGATASERAAFNPMQNSSLNGEKLKALGWKCCFPPEEGFPRTVRIIRQLQ